MSTVTRINPAPLALTEENGVAAILFLQEYTVNETNVNAARKDWESMTDHEKRATLEAFQCFQDDGK